MVVLDNPVRLLAEQDVDHLAGAEPLTPLTLQPEHCRQELLRRDRAVPGLRRRQAGVAVAARARCLAEIAKQLRPATLDGLAEGQHGIEVRGEAPAVRAVALGAVDQPALLQ